MKILKDCDIEKTVSALQDAIEIKKSQAQEARASNPPVVPMVLSEIFNRAAGPYLQVSNALGHGGEFVHDLFNKTQQNLEENPWQMVRKVAVSSFAAGMFLGRLHHRRSSTGKK
jgi:hypothetical protein